MSINRSAIIQEIVTLEWEQFSQVKNVDGPADCQNDPTTFCVMRTVQAAIWQDTTLSSYLNDLRDAKRAGINLISEKYAHMMATTHPDEYLQIKNQLRPTPQEKLPLIEAILAQFGRWEVAIAKAYPHFNKNTPFYHASTLIYLRGELLTYSVNTLTHCLSDITHANANGINLAKEILIATVQYYGYASPDDLKNTDIEDETSESCGCGIETTIKDLKELKSINNLMHDMLNFDVTALDPAS